MANVEGLRARIRARGVIIADRAARQLVVATRQDVPRLTGELEQGIDADPAQLQGDRVTTTFRSTAPHSRFVNEGTGLHGPRRARIFPKTAKVMVFDVPGEGTVYARSTQGMRAQPFATREQLAQRWRAGLEAAVR